ncbi:MAG: carbamoyltransferase HypF [Gammaproteobacteria bacterium]|nr:carbamoyltransferase HypF [Gammaproteobacteria bacterium]NIR81743.1 carbamoyltransferase HypF [Gammaproteobacteria bacterium]NIR88546.1 carbamoyltransferase HypF [Gammaproteobacteria bacterium]NIU02850.1 carbamoyltransferase HypF [Gammaproteobacteria bacterium]NIV50372.1 carbamoyltransferase HypF [Gammaproteobacteria bacterium]
MNPSPPVADQALRWRLGGQVQGVGFRPFVYRIAGRHALKGWVQNRLGDVEILGQGAPQDLARFEHDLVHRAPPLARPVVLARECAPLSRGLGVFHIRGSEAQSEARIHVPPDYFTCEDCLVELRDRGDRRHRYAFINCTQCGPRYTLIERLPYDRPNTAMRTFALCPACRQEYDDPLDRRFHAEAVGCPRCGPRLQLEPGGRTGDDALAGCIRALGAGGILAVKGVGGYHLVCDAASDDAVRTLRERKPRPDKPLAVMFPLGGGDGLDAVRAEATLRPQEMHQLTDPMRPIVLVRKAPHSRLSPLIAPGLGELGAMLPYSPLHHLMLADFGAPVVVTSGNISGEPVLTDNADAERRLGHVADAFLHHDRPIVRPADDPVFRCVSARPRPLRLGRGCAPLELDLAVRLPRPVLAVGAHMKNTIALAWDDRAVISPHIGDMGTPRSLDVFERLAQDLQELYQVSIQAIVCDAHPGYASTRWTSRQALPVTRVYHHHAHASALAGELPATEQRLVFTWDGVGYGEDGTLWGGEALLGQPGAWRRVARLRPFRLPGGERASREPWRSALGVCWEAGTRWETCPTDATLLAEAWHRRINSPRTSAAGRLFDAAAALTGVNRRSSFEGQGPMYLEAVAGGPAEPLDLPLAHCAPELLETDWQPLLPLLQDRGIPVAERSAIFHATLAKALLDQALSVRARTGTRLVGLCGGVFQNRLLTEQCEALLSAHGFAVQLAERLPVNDAAISFGQIIEYAARDAAPG